MTVVFICSSLEPGCDGVGDYTRRLAGELIRQGLVAGIIALHDDYLHNPTEIVVQKDDDTEIKVLRISSDLPWAKKINIAGNYINEYDPSWLSLQYVPFGFQDKGLPLLLGNVLSKVGKGRKWHIMFHELWLGMEINSSFKMKLWGYFQKKTIQFLINSLLPKVIHTQCSLYKEHLTRLGFEVNYLPLFGNIPVVNIKNIHKTHDKLVFVVFGTIHPNAPIELFTKKLSEYSEKCRKEVSVTFIGKNGSELSKWTKFLSIEHIQFNLLHEQPVDSISKVLLEADYGITSNPVILIEKSGTTIAMIEHGLPIISVSNSWKLPFEVKKPNFLEDVYLIDKDLNLIQKEKAPITDRLFTVAKEITISLN